MHPVIVPPPAQIGADDMNGAKVFKITGNFLATRFPKTRLNSLSIIPM
jgi:hypothetical protein